MESLLFKDLLILLGFSIVILLIGYRLRLPPIVGFLVTGVLAGPHGWSLISKTDDVEKLADLGIILLLFGIGMEFSLKKLVQIKRLFLLGGTLQVGLTIFLVAAFARLYAYPWNEAIFFGALLAMSSTAIVLGMLEQKGETASPHGRLSLSILIFQDMIAIPMILLVPLLKNTGPVDTGFLWQLFLGVVILSLVFFSAERIIPKILYFIAYTRNKELFLLTVLTICFGVAWFTSALGLSLTIGAFLAGLIISESEYSHEAISNIFPFQALFISFFFVSIGMLLDFHIIVEHPLLIISLTCLVLLVKITTAGITTWLVGLPIRTALFTAVALSQIGEFSFVLAKTGMPYDLISENFYQIFLAVSLLTMAISPILFNFVPTIISLFLQNSFLEKKLSKKNRDFMEHEILTNHLIIVGFGVTGQHLARSSKLAQVPYCILETNPQTVRAQKQKGEPIQFGDACHFSILKHAQIEQAKALAVLVNDAAATKQIVKLARKINPALYIITRTHYVQDMASIIQLGADEVIPDEFGTSVEIFTRVLKQYYVPTEDIQSFIQTIRSDGYELLREKNIPINKSIENRQDLAAMEIDSFRLHSNSPLVHKVLSESQLRQLYGVTVLFIRRGMTILPNPSSDTVLMPNDIVVVVGEKMKIPQASHLFGSLT